MAVSFPGRQRGCRDRAGGHHAGKRDADDGENETGHVTTPDSIPVAAAYFSSNAAARLNASPSPRPPGTR